MHLVSIRLDQLRSPSIGGGKSSHPLHLYANTSPSHFRTSPWFLEAVKEISQLGALYHLYLTRGL